MSTSPNKEPRKSSFIQSHIYEEGMARVIGFDAFAFAQDPQICWHCGGDKKCACAGCGNSQMKDGQWVTGSGKCECCKGSGLLVWADEVI